MSMHKLGKIFNTVLNVLGIKETDKPQQASSSDSSRVSESVWTEKSNSTSKENSNIDSFGYSESEVERYCKDEELSREIRGAFDANDKVNSSDAEKEIAKVCIREAYKYLSEKNGKVEKNELINLAQQYYIAIKTESTIEEFQAEKDKFFSNAVSLKRKYKKYCFTHFKFGQMLKDEDITQNENFEKFVQDCIVNISDKTAIKNLKAQGITNPSQEQIDNEKRRLSLKLFGDILASTDKEDRSKMMDAVQYLDAKNRYKATYATVGASANKTDAAKRYLGDRHNICNGLNDDEITQIQALGYHYAAAEDAQKASFEDVALATRYNIDELQKKVNAGIPLSAEEEASLKAYSMLSGAQIGIAGNISMTSNEKEALMANYNEELAKNDLYKNVTEKSNSYLERHQENSYITKEQFSEIMDKTQPKNAFSVNTKEAQTAQIKDNNPKNFAQNNNQKTINDSKKAPLNESKKINNKAYITKPSTEPASANTGLANHILTSQTPKKEDKKVTTDTKTTENLIKEHGKVKAVAMILGENTYKQADMEDAISEFENANTNIKEQMLNAVAFHGFGVLVRSMSNDERVEVSQDDSSINHSRKIIIRKQYVHNEAKTA